MLEDGIIARERGLPSLSLQRVSAAAGAAAAGAPAAASAEAATPSRLGIFLDDTADKSVADSLYIERDGGKGGGHVG
jgi:hypothetical protein